MSVEYRAAAVLMVAPVVAFAPDPAVVAAEWFSADFSVGSLPWKSLLTFIQPCKGRTCRFGAGNDDCFSGAFSAAAMGVADDTSSLVLGDAERLSLAKKEDTLRTVSSGV